ncbi:MAG: acyl carrier protein [Oscillospiraceae bacterium]
MFETVRKVLAEQLEVDPAMITMETDIIEDLGADSLDLVELVMSLEEHYDIVLTDDKTANVRTVGQVVNMLEQFA